MNTETTVRWLEQRIENLEHRLAGMTDNIYNRLNTLEAACGGVHRYVPSAPMTYEQALRACNAHAELLEACKVMLKMFPSSAYVEIYDLASAAIAKAETPPL